ncbi:sodium/calcium exchanger NCL1 [Quercus suber]|uniref:sodium/calcium exchanger NCL1 n=1 Tax=Quercus suber TaxID=58331 RepID=UPI0032DE48DA
MAKKFRFVLLAILFRLITLSYPCWSEPITNIKSLGKVPHEIQRVQLPTFHGNPLISSDGCEQTYGVMPCANTVLGNGFLILVYAYCIFWAAKILTDGSEILLEILGPGIIGGLSLLIFSSLPNAIIILASGLSETKETAQSQLSIGMGLVAGTAVNLLTLLWGSSVLFSRHDLEDSADSTNTKRFSFTGSVVKTDIQTTYAARIMVISVIPIMVVLLPQAFKKTSQSRYALLISVIVSFSLLVSYGVYQIFQPWIQKRKLDYANQKHELSNKHSKSNATRIFYKENGEPDAAAIINMVLAWLFNLLTKDLQSSVIYFKIVRDVWLDLQHRYSQGNGPKTFELREEKRKKIGAGKKLQVDLAALTAKNKPAKGSAKGKSRCPQCTHCGNLGHVVDKCYNLHGYPLGYKFKSKGQQASSFANNPVVVEDNSNQGVNLTHAKYQQLLC